jgi:single-strand DNA-binding protein
MKDLNSLTISGIVANDPEVKHVGQRGTAMLTFRLFTQREYTYNERTTVDKSYFDVKVWGQYAEDTGKNLKANDHVSIQGRLTQESWESNGEKKYKICIIAETVLNNDRRDHPVGVSMGDTEAQAVVRAQDPYKTPPPPFPSGPIDVKATILEDESIDDIPF